MKKLRLKNNNLGMTLVELLVAIAIFAAAIVPMLYAFVYSTGFNFKAQQTQQSTGIAQAIIEKCKAANVDYDQLVTDITSGDILSDARFSYDTPTVSGSTFRIENVRATQFDGSAVNDAVDGGSSSRRAYDVEVTITPVTEAITDYSTFHPMRADVTANFITAASSLRSADQTYQGQMFDALKDAITAEVAADSLPAAVANELIAHLDVQKLMIERVITITADDSDVKLKVEYNFAGYDSLSSYQYSNSSLNVGGTNYNVHINTVPTTTTFTAEWGATHDLETKILDGHPASSVFFYYYPCYGASDGTDSSDPGDDTAAFTDHFILVNNMTVDFKGENVADSRLDFYLFKQFGGLDPLNPVDPVDEFYDKDDIQSLDDNYKVIIDMNSTAPFRTDLYHNLLWNCKTGNGVSGVAYPTVSEGSNCFNRTVPVTCDSSYPYAHMVGGDPVTQHYKDAFYVKEESDPYYHDSMILEDKACVPYGSERLGPGGSLPGKFGSRFDIIVVVYPHGSSDAIETMSGQFLNW